MLFRIFSALLFLIATSSCPVLGQFNRASCQLCVQSNDYSHYCASMDTDQCLSYGKSCDDISSDWAAKGTVPYLRLNSRLDCFFANSHGEAIFYGTLCTILFVCFTWYASRYIHLFESSTSTTTTTVDSNNEKSNIMLCTTTDYESNNNSTSPVDNNDRPEQPIVTTTAIVHEDRNEMDTTTSNIVMDSITSATNGTEAS